MKKVLKKSEVLKEGREIAIKEAAAAIRKLLEESNSGVDFGNNTAYLDNQWADDFDAPDDFGAVLPPEKPIHPLRKPFVKRPATPDYMKRSVPFPEVLDDAPTASEPVAPVPAGPGPVPAPVPAPVEDEPVANASAAVPGIIDAVIADQAAEHADESPAPEPPPAPKEEYAKPKEASKKSQAIAKREKTYAEKAAEFAYAKARRNPDYSVYPDELLHLCAEKQTHDYNSDQWNDFFNDLKEFQFVSDYEFNDDFGYSEEEGEMLFTNLEDYDKCPKNSIKDTDGAAFLSGSIKGYGDHCVITATFEDTKNENFGEPIVLKAIVETPSESQVKEERESFDDIPDDIDSNDIDWDDILGPRRRRNEFDDDDDF